jgi:radical SAM protein with 4Fe4S-binding SPASM domain
MGRREPCGGPFKAPVIHVDGRVTVCCKDVSLELCLGNINEESFEVIWNNEKANKIRLAHITGDLDEIPKCKFCKNLDNTFVNKAEIKEYLISINREDLIEDER